MAVTAVPASLPAPSSACRTDPFPPAPSSPAAPASLASLRGRVPVSATLAANEALGRRREAGEPVLPLAFGEAGLPVHPALRGALGAVTGGNDYGPVAGRPELRAAAAGYWARRGLPTTAEEVVSGPGSKPLLFGLLLALGTDVAMPQPSWVSYAAQTAMVGARAHFVPAPPGEGGVCDPAGLDRAVSQARAAGRRIGSVIVTLPDNPTGQLARPGTVRDLAEVAAEHDLVIISDEIYRDLVHDTAPPFTSPAAFAPGRTVVTTSPSKSLALGGWRIGVARMPDGHLGRVLRDRLLGVCSEIWSAPAGPIQEAAALAFREPPEITERVASSRRLHATVCRAVAATFAAAGLAVPAPHAAFYTYPDFAPWREHLARRHGVATSADLARHLLDRYGMGVLPGSVFGERESALRLRVATGLLYGETSEQQERALAAPDPLALPWIAAALARLTEILADLAPRAPAGRPGHDRSLNSSCPAGAGGAMVK
jgi:aspartate aminotransferase